MPACFSEKNFQKKVNKVSKELFLLLSGLSPPYPFWYVMCVPMHVGILARGQESVTLSLILAVTSQQPSLVLEGRKPGSLHGKAAGARAVCWQGGLLSESGKMQTKDLQGHGVLHAPDSKPPVLLL